MTIQRYSFGGHRPDRDSELGEYVRFEDHQRELAAAAGKSGTPAEILLARKKLCFKIAEEVLDEIGTSPIPPEDIAQVINMHLPLTYIEADAEFDSMDDGPTPPLKPSIFARLRKALNYSDGANPIDVIRLACERLEATATSP